MWLHHGCFWVDRAFPGATEERWKEEQAESMERRERNGRKHRCSGLISWSFKSDKRIITITTILSQTFLLGEKTTTTATKQHSWSQPIWNKYLVLDPSYLFSSPVDRLSPSHSHFCCIRYRNVAPTLTSYCGYTYNAESWVWQTFTFEGINPQLDSNFKTTQIF